MPHRQTLETAPPATDVLLHRGDSGADIIGHELGQNLEAKLASEYPTVFHIYSSRQLGDSTDTQSKLYAVARTKLQAMKCQPLAHNPAAPAHSRGASTIIKCWHSLTGRAEAPHSDSHLAAVCAPQLWRKSVQELFSDSHGLLEPCDYLPGPLTPVVKLPRTLNVIMRMLLNNQALETHGIFRLAAANDAAAMNRWFDWIEFNNNVPEYGAIPNLSPLDFAVLLKRWMSSLADEDRVVPAVCSQAIHALLDQHAADSQPGNQQFFKDAIRCMLQCLDPQRLSVLACILHVAQAVIAKSSRNSMDGENLAKMLAPSMFAFGHVSATDAYDWAIAALTVMFAEKDIGWWFRPMSYDPLAQLLAK